MANWGGTGNSYLPYHQYLQQRYSQLQSSDYGTRSLVYKQISYSQQTWDNAKETYAPSDSGLFAYTNQGWATSYTRYSFTQDQWGGYYKLTYTYDGSGNQLSYLNQAWDNTSDTWVNSSLLTNTYDGAGHMLTALTQTWGSEARSWNNVQNFNYSYDANGNKIQQTFQNWDAANNVWVNTSQIQNSYDANNRLTATITLASNANGALVNTGQTLYVYDNSGNLLTQTSQTWTNNAWVNYTMVTNTYNASNGLTSSLAQVWGTSNWYNATLVNNTFDANNNLIQQMGLNWDYKNNVWDSASLNTYTYNTANKILNETDRLNTPAGFMNTYQYTYTYDGNNNNTEYQSFQNIGGAWTPIAVYQYSYDGNGNPVYEQYQFYSLQTASFQPQNQYYFHYESFDEPTGITSVSKNDFGATLYPNPATGSTIYVNLSSGAPAGMEANADIVMNIYDVNGRIINTGFMPLASGSHQVELGGANLASGTYFLQLISKDGSEASVLPFVKQ